MDRVRPVSGECIAPSDAWRIARLEKQVAFLEKQVAELQRDLMLVVRTASQGFDRIGELGAATGEHLAQHQRRITNLENVHGK